MILDVGLRDYELRTIPNSARTAEEIGYGCLWTSETQHDPFASSARRRSTQTHSISRSSHLLSFAPRSLERDGAPRADRPAILAPKSRGIIAPR